MAKKTYYDVLQVSKNAPSGVVEAAYGSLVQHFHPDKNPGNLDAERQLRAINRAYEVLSDPERRREYDRSPWDADEIHAQAKSSTFAVQPAEKSDSAVMRLSRTQASEKGSTNTKPSDEWLVKIWTYVVLPIFPIGMLLLTENSGIHKQQFVFLAICVALIYGLHSKKMWAWWLNWIGILAVAAIPLKFGVLGGAVAGLWIGWNFVAWRRLKFRFS